MIYRVEIWWWGEKKELEKIMMDYIKWIFDGFLDFCTPKYPVISRELTMDKLRTGNKNYEIYEERILNGERGCLIRNVDEQRRNMNVCRRMHTEQKERGIKIRMDIGSLKELRRKDNLEEEIINRKRDIQRQ